VTASKFTVPAVLLVALQASVDDAHAEPIRCTRKPGGPSVIEVVARQTYVRREPSGNGARFGVVRKGARMDVKCWTHGRGCRNMWYVLKRGGFICGEQVKPTVKPAGGPRYPVLKRKARLPFSYVLTGRDGSVEYSTVEDAESDWSFRDLEPGFGLTVRRVVSGDDVRVWRTTRNTYVPTADVFRVRGSSFKGQVIRGRHRLPLVFVHGRRARVFRRPGVRARKTLKRFTRITAAGTGRDRRRRLYLAVPPYGYVRARSVRVAYWTARPAGVGPSDKWLDIDLTQQTLVAYKGGRPVYATLVSTGRRRGKTPVGTFRVWAKLAATDMKSPPGTERPYEMWNVPWTMYFKKGIALHGTYWHNRFGWVRSHGCVNMSPADARWVFDWSPPEDLTRASQNLDTAPLFHLDPACGAGPPDSRSCRNQTNAPSTLMNVRSNFLVPVSGIL
jgi:hypothetical protein